MVHWCHELPRVLLRVPDPGARPRLTIGYDTPRDPFGSRGFFVAGVPTGSGQNEDIMTNRSDSTPSDQLPADGAQDEPVSAHSTDVAVPQDQQGIDHLRLEIDSIDGELLRLIQRRTALSHAIGTARKSLGGPRIVYSREMAVLERFRELGPSGADFAMMLLSMGRGRLGRK